MMIRFAGTEVQVLAAFAAVGISIDPAHLRETGATKTVYLQGATSVEGRGDVRLDFKFIADLVRVIEPERTKTKNKPARPAKTKSRGPHADVLVRGPGVIERFASTVKALPETKGKMPPEMKAKWAKAKQTYKKLKGGAKLLYHTPLDELPEGRTLPAINTPLSNPVHRFA